ncbi:hypothetical protein J4442_02030 [Candidatus Woesearchaeota archaeon]|nr:hypothetical protein [Candidatus Woesearchaeota archaeon]
MSKPKQLKILNIEFWTMNIKKKLEEWFKKIYGKTSNKKLKHVCRICHHIFDEVEMTESDPSICKICSKRE